MNGEHEIRQFEVFLLRMGCASDSPFGEIENTNPGGGVMMAYTPEGHQFTIEVKYCGGPKS